MLNRMDLSRIVSELKKERDRIDRAIAVLDGGNAKELGLLSKKRV